MDTFNSFLTINLFMTKFKEKYEASDAFVQKRPAPKSKGWYSIVENGILVTKPRTKKNCYRKTC